VFPPCLGDADWKRQAKSKQIASVCWGVCAGLRVLVGVPGLGVRAVCYVKFCVFWCAPWGVCVGLRVCVWPG